MYNKRLVTLEARIDLIKKLLEAQSNQNYLKKYLSLFPFEINESNAHRKKQLRLVYECLKANLMTKKEMVRLFGPICLDY